MNSCVFYLDYVIHWFYDSLETGCKAAVVPDFSIDGHTAFPALNKDYHTMVSCALAHVETKINTMSLCVNIIPFLNFLRHINGFIVYNEKNSKKLNHFIFLSLLR